jgi:hypothetical protein
VPAVAGAGRGGGRRYRSPWRETRRLAAGRRRAIQPANHASLRLVRRLGFGKEGYSPDMLFIDGAWRGHERWAITREMTGLPPVSPHPTQPAR